MSVTLSPPMFLQFFDPNNTGAPLQGGKLFTYIAGTSTKQATWTDSTQVTQNNNPIILDANGAAYVWLDPTLTYKFVLSPANDTDPPTSPLRSVDNISPNITSATLTAALIGSILYPRTVAEIAVAITPTSFAYPEGDIRRYGALVAASTNHVAFNSAFAVSGAGGAAVYIPGGTWAITTPITVAALSSMYGAGNASVISVNGCDGLTFANDPGILPFTRFFMNFQIIGVGTTCQNFHAVYVNYTVGSVVSGCLFQNLGIRNFGWQYYLQGLEDANFIGCQGYNNYYAAFFFQQSVTQSFTDCVFQRGSIGAPAGGLGTGACGIVITGNPEQEDLHIHNCSIFGYDRLISVALCFELQITACDLSAATLVAIDLGSALGPLIIRDNWIETTNGAAATTGINLPNVTPTINNKQVIEGNYLRNDNPFAGSVGINVGNGNAGTIIRNNHTIQYDKGITLGASTGIICEGNTVNITQGNTAYSAASVSISMSSLAVDNRIGPNFIINGVTQAATMANASANIGVPSSTLFPVGTPVQFDAAVNGFFIGTTYYVLTSAANVITVAAIAGGSAISATGATAVNVFQAPAPITYSGSTPPGLQLFARGSFLMGVTGFSPAVTPQPVDYVANGFSVSLNVRVASVLIGTSNATTLTALNVPQHLWPISTQQFLAQVEDSGATTYGLGTLTNAGVMTFFKTPNGGAFTNSGAKGVNTLPMTWLFT